MERGVIEVAPLAFMRGRTLNDSFVILDEAQNTTSEQMKMFLTRLGFGSKAVVTGDVTQIDLPTDKRSGLVEAIAHPATGVEGIGFMRFTRGRRGAPPAGPVDHPRLRARGRAARRAAGSAPRRGRPRRVRPPPGAARRAGCPIDRALLRRARARISPRSTRGGRALDRCWPTTPRSRS